MHEGDRFSRLEEAQKALRTQGYNRFIVLTWMK
jgi:hypothetical protein